MSQLSTFKDDKDPSGNEESILQALQEILRRIKKGNLSGALDTLIYLNFEETLLPSKDNRTLTMVDRGSAFGAERARETGDHLRLCEIALKNLVKDDALANAESALARWQRK